MRLLRRFKSSRTFSLGRDSAMKSSRRLFSSEKDLTEPPTWAPALMLKEENIQGYRLKGFHPVSIGDTFKEGRLAVHAFVIGTDQRTLQYVALKILRADSTNVTPLQPREADIMQHIAQADPSHPGHQHVVKSLDSFTHIGPHGEHPCIVFESLGESVLDLQKRWEKGRLPTELVRSIAQQTLLGLDYIHRSCGLVHTDLRSGNILFDIQAQDSRAMVDLQPQTAEGSMTTEVGHVLLPSKPIAFTDKLPVKVEIADFGVANWVDKHWLRIVQPPAYRAPEVILDAPWSTPIDIWSFGCMIHEMYVGKYLFHPSATADWTYEEDHLAQMMEVAQITSIPSNLLDKAKNATKFCRKDGILIRIPVLQADTHPEQIIRVVNPELDGGEVREFGAFMEAIMKVDLETRPTAAELLKHPWIKALES